MPVNKAEAYPQAGIFKKGESAKFDLSDGTWTRVADGWAKNLFNGTTLTQHLVTPGIHGVPRRTQRIITNYGVPAQADTTYVDALGDERPKHPTFFKRTHSKEFMNNVDRNLEPMVPKYSNEQEARAAYKRKLGGHIELIPHP